MTQSISAGIPTAFIIAHFIATRDRVDLEQGLLGNTGMLNIVKVSLHCAVKPHSCTIGFSLSALLSATVLNVIKISVGR